MKTVVVQLPYSEQMTWQSIYNYIIQSSHIDKITVYHCGYLTIYARWSKKTDKIYLTLKSMRDEVI